MKTIIAGSRNVTDYSAVRGAIASSGFKITEVVSGCAAGVDRLGERYAADFGIPVKRFPADWGKHGKSAGPIRNQQMAEYAEALVALRIDGSRGTTDMITRAHANGLKVFVVDVRTGEEDFPL